MKRFTLSIACLVLVACSNTQVEQITLPDGVTIEKHVQITMRDGARLNTLVMLPEISKQQSIPAILIRTPYKSELEPLRELPIRLLEQGYALVMQHERGRYFSEGDFQMLTGAADDGLDTLDWITKQSWSNGEVGTYGCSSSGENQLKLAAQGHPAHKAMVAGSVGVGIAETELFKEQGNFWRGGAWQQGWLNYFHSSMLQDWPQLPRAMSNKERQQTLSYFDLNNKGWEVPSSAYNEPRMHLPMIDILTQIDSPRNEINDYLAAGPFHESWGEFRVSTGEMISVPGLWFESLYDISARSSIDYFEWNKTENYKQGRNNQAMHITQGGHCSFGVDSIESEHAKIGDLELGDMRYNFVEMTVNWFNRWMKPHQETSQVPSSYTAFVGYGKWLQTDALHTQAEQVWYLTAESTLSTSYPSKQASFVYSYDPSDPVISHGGEISGVGDDQREGSFDQREAQNRQDILVFTSEPLTEGTTFFGMAQPMLSVSSDQPDTDFTIKILDVYPDGRAFNIGDSILRMRYRDSLDSPNFMQKDKIYDIKLPPIMLSRTIQKNHRLQIEVSSSNFPAYARNLNTEQNPYTSTEFVTATNTLHLGVGHNTSISLPVYIKPLMTLEPIK
jgi:hypothetical protein